MPGPLVVIGAITLAASLFGSVSQAKAARRARKRQQFLMDRLRYRIRRITAPENFAKVFNQLRPIFREATLQNFQPAVESATATQVARRGLTGTGLGAALTSSAAGAGELATIRSAIGGTEQQLNRELQGAALEAGLGVSPVEFAAGQAEGDALRNFGIDAATFGSNFLGQPGRSETFPVPGDPGFIGPVQPSAARQQLFNSAEATPLIPEARPRTMLPLLGEESTLFPRQSPARR